MRKIAGGDVYTIIYLKMLLKSLETDGELFFEGYYDNFIEELAADIDEEADNVRVVVGFLVEKGLLIEREQDTYLLTRCAEMTGAECDSARRVRQYREARALQCNADVTESNALVTMCNTEKEIELEKEKRKSKSKRTVREDCDTETASAFEAFWQAYPKKVGKADAKKAFAKVPKSEWDKLLPAIEAQKATRQWRENNGQYVPYPATWLNGRRWEDEVKAVVDERETDNVFLAMMKKMEE